MWNPFKKKKSKEVVHVRTYAGAEYGRLVSDWVSSGASFDAEIRGSLRVLRNRARDLVRNNDYAKNVVREIKNNVVGQGYGFQCQIKQQRGEKLNDKLNEKIEAEFKKWCRKENCNTAGKLSFAQIQRTIMGQIPECGEAVIRMVRRRFGNSKIPLALQVLDADMLDDQYNGTAPNGNQIRMGVEVDKWGRPVAFHLFTTHPGDYSFSHSEASNLTTRIRVEAKDIIHLFIPESEKQTRAPSWFSSTLMRVRQMGGYEEAEVIAARASASVQGYITTPEGELVGDDIQDGQRVTDFEAGTIRKLNPGEQITVPNMSRPGGTFDPFMRAMLRGVAAGVGASYESVSKDYSQTSYSSARQSILSERDNWKVIQSWLEENFHKVVFENWLDMAVMAEVISLPNYENDSEMYYQSVRWIPRGWTWIDPGKEIDAAKESVRSGFSTLTDVLASSGQDFDEILSQRSRELKACEAANIVFDTDPTVDSKKATPHNSSTTSDQQP